MKKASRAVVVSTKQDLTVLTLPQLKKLRERADEMGLADFRKRIDAQIETLKGPRILTEREQALREALGEMPPSRVPRDLHAFWNEAGTTLAIEIPEGELEPIPGGGWAWEKKRGALEDERAELREANDIESFQALGVLTGSIFNAWQQNRPCIRAIMYRPLSGGGKHHRLMPQVGYVVDCKTKGNVARVVAFRIEFRKEAA